MASFDRQTQNMEKFMKLASWLRRLAQSPSDSSAQPLADQSTNSPAHRPTQTPQASSFAWQTLGRWAACAAIVTLPLALIGCGGGGSSDNTNSPSLSSSTDPALTSPDEVQAKNEAEAETQQKLGNYKFACLLRRNNTPEKLTECVTVDGVRFHQRVLQYIADNNNGTRVSGTKGFDDSARYAEAVFKAFGYQVTKQEFEFQSFIKLSPTVLEQVTPSGNQAISTTIFSYSGSGDVTAPTTSPSVITGCNTTDFAGFASGNVALISRGGCTFASKATNAAAAGAKAVVIFNNREGPLNGTLGEDFRLDLPVVSITQVKGSELLSISGLKLRVKTETFRGTATTANIIAESKDGDPNNVVMVGAHLDSVDEGPGINDNGSGAAVLLETAIQMARSKPKNKVRFALWGAEESGLVGSEKYIELLPEAERAKIALYLNFDMVGSPNPVYFVYDGDDSDKVGAGPGPAGSAAIEKLFEKFYTDRKLPFKGTDFDGRSDYGPFIAAGIPAGGLFTGAEGIKTAEEAQLWGGTAGEAYDKCYHQACDTYDNVNLTALDVNADAVAYSTLMWAMDLTPLGTRTASANKLQQGNNKFQSTVPKWSHYPKLVAE
jgi:Zn-dependent M28 family amino/carboxypeptidase